ncbi:MAG: hypothetical protein ACLR67_00225 [Eggerthella lenta]
MFVDTIIVVTMTALVVLSVLYVGDGTLTTGDYATLTAETITRPTSLSWPGQFRRECGRLVK